MTQSSPTLIGKFQRKTALKLFHKTRLKRNNDENKDIYDQNHLIIALSRTSFLYLWLTLHPVHAAPSF